MALLACMSSLTENEGIRETRPTARNVHRPSARKVKRGQVKQPAIAIPCPTCDWLFTVSARLRYGDAGLTYAVDNRGPPK